MKRPGFRRYDSGIRSHNVGVRAKLPVGSAVIANRSPSTLPHGLSLLEVILALAILAGSVAAIGELLRNGMLNASDARDYTRAELHAESIMSQIVAGAIATGSISGAPVEDDPNFTYSVVTEQIDQAGLLGVHVTVTHIQTTQRKPAEFTLTRWMVDPQMEMELASQAQANAQANAEARAAAQENASSNSSTGNSSSGGSPSSSATKPGGGR